MRARTSKPNTPGSVPADPQRPIGDAYKRLAALAENNGEGVENEGVEHARQRAFEEAEELRHQPFRELCLLYGDFNRPVFLEAILDWFVRSADETELATLRNAIARRAGILKDHRGKKGRPRGRSDEEWLVQAKTVAWRFHVQGWTWPQIAESAGKQPTKPNFRTLQRQRDSYAAVIWDAINEALASSDPSPERIRQALETPKMQQWLWIKGGVPFRRAPQESKAFVEALLPHGEKASGAEFFRQIEYLTRKKTSK